MRDPHIALVGIGALGSALALRLAHSGIANVLLIDPDAVEARNLPLSPFLQQALQNANFGERKDETSQVPAPAPLNGPQTPETCLAELGAHLYKAELLAGEAQCSYGLPWRALPAAIADAGWQDLDDCDLICSCTDSALARVETAFAARMLGKPMLDGGLSGKSLPEGRVTWFAAAPQAACYLCGLSAERRAQILAYAASASLGCAAIEEAAANTATLDASEQIAAAMLRQINRFGSGTRPETSTAERLTGNRAWNNAVFADRTAHPGPAVPTDSTWRAEPIALQVSQTCPWHEPFSGHLLTLPLDTPIDVLLESAPPGSLLQLAWPICTGARCRQCCCATEVRARVAQLRRDLACPNCGRRGTLEPISIVASIPQNSHAGTQTLRQLSQPERHLYLLRQPFRPAAGN